MIKMFRNVKFTISCKAGNCFYVSENECIFIQQQEEDKKQPPKNINNKLP